MTSPLRLNIFLFIVITFAGLIMYRLFTLSFVKHSLYAETSKAQQENINNILVRGNIYLKTDGVPFLAAANKKFPLVYIVPSVIDKSRSGQVSESLSEILAIEIPEVEKIINSSYSGYRVISKKLSDEQVNKVKNLNEKSVGIRYEAGRFYPAETLAADVIGFYGDSPSGRAGQYGVEAYFEDDLNGNEAQSRPADIILTIDKNIQSAVESKLDELIKKWNAVGGTIIVQEPQTGKILAMTDRPTFNPNEYSIYNPRAFLNTSVQEEFEPGSSMKPITMAAGLELGKITPTTRFIDTGSVQIGGFTIKNFNERVFGDLNMINVLEKSINTGAMFVEQKVGDENFLNHLINIGFGQKTGIDLPGEISGDIANLYSGRKINYLTASFGQGIAVTPIQLINAYSTIANGGKLMKPYVVEKIIKRGGSEIETKPEVVAIPLSEKTTTKLKSMLVSVVDQGFDKARIKGYDIAGKTGTAQIPDGKGGYEENTFVHNFLGFAPAYNPKFVILIKIDKPQGVTFAADSLSPAFKDIAQYLINYYEIPPGRLQK